MLSEERLVPGDDDLLLAKRRYDKLFRLFDAADEFDNDIDLVVFDQIFPASCEEFARYGRFVFANLAQIANGDLPNVQVSVGARREELSILEDIGVDTHAHIA